MESGYFEANRTSDVVIRGIPIGEKKSIKTKAAQIDSRENRTEL